MNHQRMEDDQHRIEKWNAFHSGAKFGAEAGRRDLLLKLFDGLHKDYGIILTPEDLKRWGVGIKEEKESP